MLMPEPAPHVPVPIFAVPAVPEHAGPNDGPNDAKRRLDELLRELREGRRPVDFTPPTQKDSKLENLKDREKLRRAAAALTVKGKDKLLDVLFRSRISGMLGVLNLYLD
jgi:hypothetical protein